MFYGDIGNNLVIRKGRIVCKDGRPLMKYLQQAGGHQNGDEINIVLHKHLLQLNSAFPGGKFRRGDLVRKTKGSHWCGRVCGFYSTNLTPDGYAVESLFEAGSVQIYPAAALVLVDTEDAKYLEDIQTELKHYRNTLS